MELFEPPPCLIKRFTLHLREGVISFWSLAVFPREKYLYKNTLERPSQVVNELAFEFRSQDLVLSFKEKGNSLNQMASFETHVGG